MQRRQTFFALALLPFVLLACSLVLREEVSEPPEESSQQGAPPLPPEELVTRNVTYTGLLEEGGVTIYQQGTHRLTLSDGRMVILEPAEGSMIALDLYEGKLVQVHGDVMPTVEAAGTLMKVRRIEWIRRETNAEGEEVEVMRSLCGEGTVCPPGYVCRLGEGGGICVEEESEETKESEEAEESKAAQEVEDEEGEEEVEEVGPSSAPAGAMEGKEVGEDEEEVKEEEEEAEEAASAGTADAQVAVMDEEDLAAARWTQQYCSAHIGFCIPVHKNWYYKSFGATSSVLWHVEVGAQTVENLGDGPLVVDLLSGDLSTLGVTDGAVREVGGKIVGYRTWSDNRHFETSADAALKEAVTYITKGLKASE